MPFGRVNGGKPLTLVQKSTAAIADGAVVKNSGSAPVGCVVATTDATGICGLARYAGDNVIGAPVTVVQDGLYDGIAGGTISIGDALMPTTAGSLIVITGTGTHYIVGYAEEAAVSGDRFSVRIQPGQLYLP